MHDTIEVNFFTMFNNFITAPSLIIIYLCSFTSIYGVPFNILTRIIVPNSTCVQTKNGKAAPGKLAQIRIEHSRNPNLIVGKLEMPIMNELSISSQITNRIKM